MNRSSDGSLRAMPARSEGRGNCAATTPESAVAKTTSVNTIRIKRILRFFALNDFDRFGSVLLHQRQQPGVEEANLKQHQERHRAVDALAQGVEQRGREVEAERELDHRLHRHRLAVLLL